MQNIFRSTFCTSSERLRRVQVYPIGAGEAPSPAYIPRHWSSSAGQWLSDHGERTVRPCPCGCHQRWAVPITTVPIPSTNTMPCWSWLTRAGSHAQILQLGQWEDPKHWKDIAGEHWTFIISTNGKTQCDVICSNPTCLLCHASSLHKEEEVTHSCPLSQQIDVVQIARLTQVTGEQGQSNLAMAGATLCCQSQPHTSQPNVAPW